MNHITKEQFDKLFEVDNSNIILSKDDLINDNDKSDEIYLTKKDVYDSPIISKQIEVSKDALLRVTKQHMVNNAYFGAALEGGGLVVGSLIAGKAAGGILGTTFGPIGTAVGQDIGGAVGYTIGKGINTYLTMKSIDTDDLTEFQGIMENEEVESMHQGNISAAVREGISGASEQLFHHNKGVVEKAARIAGSFIPMGMEFQGGVLSSSFKVFSTEGLDNYAKSLDKGSSFIRGLGAGVGYGAGSILASKVNGVLFKGIMNRAAMDTEGKNILQEWAHTSEGRLSTKIAADITADPNRYKLLTNPLFLSKWKLVGATAGADAISSALPFTGSELGSELGEKIYDGKELNGEQLATTFVVTALMGGMSGLAHSYSKVSDFTKKIDTINQDAVETFLNTKDGAAIAKKLKNGEALSKYNVDYILENQFTEAELAKKAAEEETAKKAAEGGKTETEEDTGTKTTEEATAEETKSEEAAPKETTNKTEEETINETTSKNTEAELNPDLAEKLDKLKDTTSDIENYAKIKAADVNLETKIKDIPPKMRSSVKALTPYRNLRNLIIEKLDTETSDLLEDLSFSEIKKWNEEIYPSGKFEYGSQEINEDRIYDLIEDIRDARDLEYTEPEEPVLSKADEASKMRLANISDSNAALLQEMNFKLDWVPDEIKKKMETTDYKSKKGFNIALAKTGKTYNTTGRSYIEPEIQLGVMDFHKLTKERKAAIMQLLPDKVKIRKKKQSLSNLLKKTEKLLKDKMDTYEAQEIIRKLKELFNSFISD